MYEKVLELAALDPDAVVADGFEDALIGWTDSWTGHSRVIRAVYDTMRVLTILIERDGMTPEEAQEHFEFNIAGAYVGEHTPVFMRTFEE